MDSGMALSGSLGLALIVLGSLYWRSYQSAQATEAQLRSQIESLEPPKQKLDTQIEELKQQCARLRSQLETQSTQTQQDFKLQAFEQIQSLLTQYPSVRRRIEMKPDLPAGNLIGMFTTLENLVKFWGYSAIGNPWEQVEFDPQLHQGDVADLEIGELVYVRFVGYRSDDRILIPAKVSRTLPTGATS